MSNIETGEEILRKFYEIAKKVERTVKRKYYSLALHDAECIAGIIRKLLLSGKSVSHLRASEEATRV